MLAPSIPRTARASLPSKRLAGVCLRRSPHGVRCPAQDCGLVPFVALLLPSGQTVHRNVALVKALAPANVTPARLANEKLLLWILESSRFALLRLAYEKLML